MKRKGKTRQGTLVYVGPTIKHTARAWTAYTDGIPAELQALAEDCPAILQMIVPIERLAEVRQALHAPNSPTSIFYSKVQQFLEGRK